MIWRFTPAVFALFGRLLPVLLLFAQAVHAVEGATGLFRQYQDRIYQIRIMDTVAEKKSGLGSGFLVSADGLIATNYHVVAKLVQKPDKYRLEYQDVAGNKGALTLVDIDVINDLALVRAAPLAKDPLRFPDSPPEQGDTIYSIGNPYDIGFTVVPGTYNGIDEKTYYPRIHFSGSINPGMSGGPVLDQRGRLVGINVSSAGDQISFLVPGTALQSLLQESQRREAPLTDFDQRIRQQLMDNQNRMISQFLTQDWTTQELGEAKVLGEMKPFVKCWGGSNDDKDLYKSVSTACRSNESIYLNDRFTSGVISYQFFWLEAGELNSSRFQSYYQMLFRRFEPDNRAYEDDVGNFVCEERFVSDKRGGRDKLIFCARAYQKYTGLYDVLYLRGSVDMHDRAFVSHFTLAGVEQKNIDAFLNRFMEVVER